MSQAKNEPKQGHTDGTPKLTVFISYSRSNLEFADRLVTGLEQRGFKCLIDRRDLEYGERWQRVLRDLIREADAVVFAVSHASITSQWCRWELSEVSKLSKRLVPVLVEPVVPEDCPPEIYEIHFMPFYGAGNFDLQADALGKVLLTDREWLREHTRLLGLALKWDAEGRKHDGLLRGSVLTDAEAWKSRPPMTSPAPAQLVEAFLSESRLGAIKSQRLRTRIAVAVALGALTLSGVAIWQSVEAARNAERAEMQRAEADAQRKVAEEQRREADVQRSTAEERRREADAQRSVAEEQRSAAERARSQAERARSDSLLRQSRYLTDLSVRTTDGGDAETGVLLALAALPGQDTVDEGNPFRPLYDPAVGQLDAALRGIKDLKVLEGHGREVTAIAVTPDGSRVISASDDATIKVWDIAQGRLLATLSGHDGPVKAVVTDGKRVISASDDKTLRLWDLASGQVIKTLDRDYPLLGEFVTPDDDHTITSLGLSKDGRKLVCGAKDNMIEIWDLETGARTATLDGHTAPVEAVAITPDGRAIVSGSSDGSIRLWDLASGKALSVFHKDGGRVARVAITPDGKRLVSTTQPEFVSRPDGLPDFEGAHDIRIWDFTSKRVLHQLKGHAGYILDIAISPDGRLLASGSLDRTIKLWDLVSGSLLETIGGVEVQQGMGIPTVNALAFSADGRALLWGASDETVKVRALEAGADVVTFKGHESSTTVSSLALTADERLLVSGGTDRTVRVWDTRTGSLLQTLVGHNKAVEAVAVTADGRKAVSAAGDRTVRVWDVTSGREEALLSGSREYYDAVLGGRDWVKSLAISPDRTKVFTGPSGMDDRSIGVYSLASGKRIASLGGHEGGVLALAVSPDGSLLASGGDDKTLRLWNVATGREIAKIVGHEHWVTSLAFFSDGRRIATGSEDGTARIWDLDTRKQLATFNGGEVSSVAVVAHDAQLIATSGSLLQVWDIATGSKVATVKLDEVIVSVLAAKDGQKIFVSDNPIRALPIWPGMDALASHAKERVSRCLTREQREQFYLEPNPPTWCKAKWPYREVSESSP